VTQGMNRVATEFAVEIVVHLKQRNPYTSPGQQQREHRTGRPTAGDAATRRLILHHLNLDESL